MVYCAAVGCTNGTNFGGSFYKFPRNKKLRKAWTAAIKRDGFNPDHHTQPVLCSDHFAQDAFDKNPEIACKLGMQVWLKKDVNPTLHV